jgi:3-hydroxyacyl-[acyl-carrier-protein] dehydratase
LSDDTGWRFEVPLGVPGDAACLSGHFPDRPIVPGAVLLGYAAHFLEAEGYKIAHIKRMKFPRPLLPEQPFTIDVTPSSDRTTVTWLADDTIFARATVTLLSHGR